MTLYTVSITGIVNPIEVYDGLPAVDDYLQAAIGDGADDWRALIVASNADQRSRILVAASRFIDSLAWQGVPTVPSVGGTTLQWPRSNIVLGDGTVVDPNSVPAPIAQGVMELCALIADDSSVLSQADSGSNIQSLQGGPARIQFFRPQSPQDGNATVLPVVLNRLVGRYLAGASAAIASALAGSARSNPVSDFRNCTCRETPCRCGAHGPRDIDWPL